MSHRANVNGDFFTPKAAGADGQVEARQLWAGYSKGQRMPSGMIAVYGDLRASGSNGRVWAFVSNGGCWSGYGPSPLPTPASGYCTTWTFLDASTGSEVDSTQQN